MDEYASINYKQVRILLEIGDNNSFYPATEVIDPLPYLPYYVEGVANLDGTISVVIDLAKFLGVDYSETTTHLVFLQMEHSEGDFVLKIPLPRIINEKINFKSLPVKDNLTRKIPSARYYAVGNATYLVLIIDDFADFLSKELSDILFQAWIKASPKWDNKIYENLVSKQQTSQIASGLSQRDRISFSTETLTESVLAFSIGSTNFIIEEKYVYDILADEFILTPLPNSVNWIRGLVNYKTESLLTIDLMAYLEIPNAEYHNLNLVISGKEGRFMINAGNIRSIPIDELSEVFVNDYEGSQLPYANILTDDNFQTYYKINVNGLEYNVLARQKTSQFWEDWIAFFQRKRNFYENTDKFLMGELQSLNSLSAVIGGQQMVIPQENIETLQTSSDYKFFEGFRFIQFGQKWIPSIDLSSYFQQESQNLQYGTIIKHKDQIMEIKSTDAMLSYIKGNLLDKTDMEQIAKSSRNFGVDSVVSTPFGYGYDLNVEQMMKVFGDIKNSNGKKLKDVIKDINKKFVITEEKEEIISDYISGMWDENSVIYLFTELHNEENNKFAYPTEDIQYFAYELPEDVKEKDIIEWEYETKDGIYFYVTVAKGKKKAKTYQIPTTSYLRAVTQDSVKKDKEGDFISLSKERIPILSFQ